MLLQIGTRNGVEELFLASRKGFVKLALAHRAALVPAYAFGCVDLYHTYDVLTGPREWLRRQPPCHVYLFGARPPQCRHAYITEPSPDPPPARDDGECVRRTCGVCIPLYSGSAGFLPKQSPLDLVVGAPLELPACGTAGQPTQAEVDAAHAQYVAALRQLFDRNKASFGYADRELTIL